MRWMILGVMLLGLFMNASVTRAFGCGVTRPLLPDASVADRRDTLMDPGCSCGSRCPSAVVGVGCRD
jgi:hypothetical protein